MDDDADYGPRLSGVEYDRRIVQLYDRSPSKTTREQNRSLIRQELELRIDYRLGQEFPRNRRDDLWRVQQRVERRRLWFGVQYVLRHISRRRVSADAQQLAAGVVKEYARVLSRTELALFLGENEARNPALPTHPDRTRE